MRFGLFYEFELPRPWDDARYEAAGVDRLLLYSQVGRNRHEHICESLARKAAAVPRARREARR